MNDKTDPGVASVNRALSILMAFEGSVDGLTLSELSSVTGLYHSTILRICESLEHYGFLNRREDGRFMLGATPFYLGMLYQDSFRLWDYAAPVLRELVHSTKETAAIYIREGNDRICLHRLSQPRSVRMHVREGERVELDKGAAGKVLLAFSGEQGQEFDLIRDLHRWRKGALKPRRLPALFSVWRSAWSVVFHWACPCSGTTRKRLKHFCHASCRRRKH